MKCDMCFADTGKPATRYCADCNKKIAARAAPKDCPFCQGKETAKATYQFEGDYGPPYVCTVCLKDENGGQYTSMPGNISHAATQGYDPQWEWEPPAPSQQRLPLS
jgi:hypothetical protein